MDFSRGIRFLDASVNKIHVLRTRGCLDNYKHQRIETESRFSTFSFLFSAAINNKSEKSGNMSKVQEFVDDYWKDTPRLEQLKAQRDYHGLLFTKFTKNNTLMHYMAAKEETSLMKCIGLIDCLDSTIVEKVDFNAVNDFGWTPLMIAASFQRFGNMKALLLRGANPFLRSASDMPLIFHAIGSCEAIMILHEHDPTLLSQRGAHDTSAWHALASHHTPSLEVLQLLYKLDIGIPIDEMSTGKYGTALAHAIARGNRKFAEELIREGAQLSLALPSFGDNIPEWAVLLALRVKDENLLGMSKTIEVLANECYELKTKRAKTDDN
jgi:Ankyrin repeat